MTQKFREMLSEVLTAEGYSVKSCANAWDAIAASEEELFNLALIDIHLPDMLGTDLLSMLRKTEPPTIKIIITGKATLDNSIEAANKGIDGYIVKPFDPKNLISLYRSQIEGAKRKDRIYG